MVHHLLNGKTSQARPLLHLWITVSHSLQLSQPGTSIIPVNKNCLNIWKLFLDSNMGFGLRYDMYITFFNPLQRFCPLIGQIFHFDWIRALHMKCVILTRNPVKRYTCSKHYNIPKATNVLSICRAVYRQVFKLGVPYLFQILVDGL